jgi:hypothetical protein
VEATVKVLPLLETPETVTTTLPVVASEGTVTVILVVFQFVAVAALPLNWTVLLPCVGPKFAPVIVTTAPTAPVMGDRLVIVGAATSAWPMETKKNKSRSATMGFKFLVDIIEVSGFYTFPNRHSCFLRLLSVAHS